MYEDTEGQSVSVSPPPALIVFQSATLISPLSSPLRTNPRPVLDISGEVYPLMFQPIDAIIATSLNFCINHANPACQWSLHYRRCCN